MKILHSKNWLKIARYDDILFFSGRLIQTMNAGCSESGYMGLIPAEC